MTVSYQVLRRIVGQAQRVFREDRAGWSVAGPESLASEVSTRYSYDYDICLTIITDHWQEIAS